MLRLTKYELRKNIMGTVILFGIIIGLEIYFVISALLENRDHTAMATAFLVIAACVSYFCLFFFGVSSYSKELRSKTGYLTFMTPISSFSVIGSKLLSIFITGVFFVILLSVLACIDMAMFENVFPETQLFTDFLDGLFNMAGYSPEEFWLTVLVNVAIILVSFYAVIALAYMSITLSSTIFQNKKYKGVISVIIFILLTLLVSKISEFLPDIYENVTRMGEAMLQIVPQLIYWLAITIGALFLSGKFLDKKVSL